jgi:xanthine dehydrogenase accessory factor
MAVLADGAIHESVGGGACEHAAAGAALRSLETDLPEIVRADMSGAGDSGMVCGGAMAVLVEPLDPARDAGWVRAVVRLRSEGKTVTLLRRLAEDPPVESRVLLVASGDGERAWAAGEADAPVPPTHLSPAEPAFFGESDPRGPYAAEAISPAERLVIVGGGHIGRALSAIGSLLGFEVTVIDERPEFAAEDRFPGAIAVVCGDPGDILSARAPGPGAYFVLVGHGYASDLRALRILARTETAYIGMIGSRKRVETVLSALEAEGIEPGAGGRLFAPIGLDIGAKTPEEIAVCIAAEIVAVRSGADPSAGHRARRPEEK